MHHCIPPSTHYTNWKICFRCIWYGYQQICRSIVSIQLWHNSNYRWRNRSKYCETYLNFFEYISSSSKVISNSTTVYFVRSKLLNSKSGEFLCSQMTINQLPIFQRQTHVIQTTYNRGCWRRTHVLEIWVSSGLRVRSNWRLVETVIGLAAPACSYWPAAPRAMTSAPTTSNETRRHNLVRRLCTAWLMLQIMHEGATRSVDGLYAWSGRERGTGARGYFSRGLEGRTICARYGKLCGTTSEDNLWAMSTVYRNVFL
jgi:hypothetical protein